MIKSYQPLARKYRPATFQELVGQDSTATALANAIKLGREPHAVIFSGVRGVGKTTSARLYAKALNCDLGSSPTPCNKCESCLAITIGNHEDVMEIDGASNTSVDDVRALRETISYVPQRSRFKVYIIDEVHMLSQNAFNALLKTLEEPPAHVVFIFATTELHKLPQTIMSRCQVFFLQRMTMQVIRDRLESILKQEGLSFEDKALTSIAREGHGSMRDALTLLDHVIAIGNGTVTMEALSKIISHATSTPFIQLLAALVARDPKAVITSLDYLEHSGIDMKDVAEKTAAMTRHAAIARDVGVEHVDFKSLGFDDDEAQELHRIGTSAKPLDLNRLFRTLFKSISDLDGSALDRFVFENYCLEWCLDPGIQWLQSTGSVGGGLIPPQQQSLSSQAQQRPAAPAAAISKGLSTMLGELHQAQEPDAKTIKKAPTAPATAAPQAREASPQPAPSSPPPRQGASSTAFPETWRQLVDAWKQQKPLQARKLEEAHPIKYSPERIELVIAPDSYASASLLRTDEQKKLKDAFAELFSFKGALIVTPKAATSSPTNPAHSPQMPLTEEPQALPETLASIKEREAIERRKKIAAAAENHPLTRDAVRMFDATIKEVIIHDS